MEIVYKKDKMNEFDDAVSYLDTIDKDSIDSMGNTPKSQRRSPGVLFKLLRSTTLSEEEQDEIERKLFWLDDDYTDKEFDELYWYLVQHQLDPIEQGQGYNQTDIIRKLYNMENG